MNDEQKNILINQIDATVSIIGRKIKSPGVLTDLLLKSIRAAEYDDVARTIKLIDTTVVN
jgi:hypothetical protein